MELYEQKSPVYVKVLKNVTEDGAVIQFRSGDIVEDVILYANDIVTDTSEKIPQDVVAVVDGEGSVDTTLYVAVTAFMFGGESLPSDEVVVEILDDTTTAVVSWTPVLQAEYYRLYAGEVETEVYELGSIETTATSVELIGAEYDEEYAGTQPYIPTTKIVEFGTSAGANDVATFVMSENAPLINKGVIFIGGEDVNTLYVTPDNGVVNGIIRYYNPMITFDKASYTSVNGGSASVVTLTRDITEEGDLTVDTLSPVVPKIVNVFDEAGDTLGFSIQMSVDTWEIVIPSPYSQVGDPTQTITINIIY